MVKLDNNNQTQTNQIDANQPNSTSTDPNSQIQGQQPFSKPTTGLFSLPPAVMNLVPWVPLLLEMTTGQKIPQMTGTMAEIQHGIQTVQMTLGQIIQQQTALDRRLTQLETNANNHLTNLTHQFNSLRLTHTKEKKEIDFNPNPNNQVNEDY
jgi:TolA-binding protein